MTMLFTQIIVVIGLIVSAFIVYTVVLQQVTQEVVHELLNKEKVAGTNTKDNKENAFHQ
ncbi:hypothetical protein [Bacillus sp. DX3.1]|uniref:hypothetical protein n=1 Tax=Bacillus sp. DX3.1 TaxID=3052091 RepID=UPI002570A1B4|nr:hypothetical protein [Bacillus sp. DX3.1]WJE84588.1 hypothetical protein QRE67_28160 [Bacillus sp. DX3.1]